MAEATDAGAESTSEAAEAEGESTSEQGAKADEQTSAESTSEGETGSEDDDEPEEWRNLVKKYESVADEKQRKAAIGKAYWENTRHASAVQKERDQLKARLAELEETGRPRAASEEAKPEPEEVPADIKAIESRTKALETEQAEFPKIEDQLMGALEKTKERISVLQYKLQVSLEEEKPSIEARLEAAHAERNNILLRYHTCKQRLSEIAEKLEDLAERKKLAGSRLDSERARQAQAEEERAQFNRDFPRLVDGYIVRFMDELKVPSGPPGTEAAKLRDDLAESVNESLMVAYWKMGGQDTRKVDHAALVKDHVTRYAKRMDLIGRAKLQQFSQKKADVAQRLSPTIRPRESKPKEPARPLLPYEVDQVDERVLKARRGFINGRG